jgi:hypothetical protein
MKRFKDACRRQSRDADPLDFEQEFGHKPDSILTRIERQYGAGRLPDTLRTFGMIGNAANVDPFEAIELETYHPLPRVEDFELGEWLKGMQIRNEYLSRGAHHFRRWLNKHSNGNGLRMMKRYAAFIPGPTVSALRKADMLNIYRE